MPGACFFISPPCPQTPVFRPEKRLPRPRLPNKPRNGPQRRNDQTQGSVFCSTPRVKPMTRRSGTWPPSPRVPPLFPAKTAPAYAPRTVLAALHSSPAHHSSLFLRFIHRLFVSLQGKVRTRLGRGVKTGVFLPFFRCAMRRFTPYTNRKKRLCLAFYISKPPPKSAP